MTTDPSAFWLYPDWDGPIKEPFWMRPLNFHQRVEPRTPTLPPPPPPTPEEVRKALWDRAIRLGFNCVNWEPKGLCRVLGRHINVRMSEPEKENWGWEATAAVRCCGSLVGSVFLRNEDRQ